MAVGLVLAALWQGAARAEGRSFNISAAPSVSDWRYFQNMPPNELARLWQDHEKTGKKLRNWSWQWRIGWMKVCMHSKSSYCDALLREGLSDKAMVVRSEAAAGLGQRFEGTRDQATLQLLAHAYKDAKNERNGKPLLIRYRILFAIDQIAGKHASDMGRDLSASHARTVRYWETIDKNRI
jgi:hypothetical protein